MHVTHIFLRNENIRTAMVDVGCDLLFDSRKYGIQREDEEQSKGYPTNRNYQPDFILKKVRKAKWVICERPPQVLIQRSIGPGKVPPVMPFPIRPGMPGVHPGVQLQSAI